MANKPERIKISIFQYLVLMYNYFEYCKDDRIGFQEMVTKEEFLKELNQLVTVETDLVESLAYYSQIGVETLGEQSFWHPEGTSFGEFINRLTKRRRIPLTFDTKYNTIEFEEGKR